MTKKAAHWLKNTTFFAGTITDTTTTLEFNLADTKTFNILLLQENIRLGQRVEKFVLEAWNDNAWKKIAEGTTVGHKRIIEFPAVAAAKVRLRILESKLNSLIAEFGLYKSVE